MSATREYSKRRAAIPAPAEDEHCLQCGTPLAADQEWCLECGSARTLVHRPPDWRVPVAVIGSVVALVLAAFVIALINLSGNANRSAATVTRATAAAVTPSATNARPSTPSTRAPATTAPAASSTQLANWPVGLPGWTVDLVAFRSQLSAQAAERRIAASGTPVGLLNSSEHPSLPPGYWIVFSGRYPTAAAAQVHATALLNKGYAGAHALLVGRPGG